ncbi:Met18p [Sporobolomyces koalae]|uniref:Met18p n=1 Tax=Sporobolomyces koalae TaxID=500713 RepID=UPI0031819602
MAAAAQVAPLLRGYLALDEPQLADSPIPAEIARGLAGNVWKLIEVVKGLQDSLTSENDLTRSRGVGLLSAVVQHLDSEALDRQSTKVLTTFFTTKLADKPSLVACATALTCLTASPAFGTGEGIEVVQGIFSSVTLKAHAQSVRHKIYVLLDALMSRSRPALKRLGQQGFLKPYCQLVEGEKDPRNLMISFGLVRIILLEFEIDQTVEDLFDVTFCYFPITFTPPADDPYGITSQDLIFALRNCLASTPLFGPLALPLFLDKLQAASEKAKRQTLEALRECFPIYGAATCGEWAGRFSEALSIEVFHATDTSMQDLALLTFHSLFATLYPDSDTNQTEQDGGDQAMRDAADARADEVVKGIAVQVVKNSLDELEEPDKSNAKPAMRILVTIAAASQRLTRYVLDQTLPPLLNLCQNPEEVSVRPSVLAHLATLLSSLSSPTQTSSTTRIEPGAGLPSQIAPASLDLSQPDSPLKPYLDTLLSLLTSSARAATAASSQPSRIPALKGLISLIEIGRGSFLSKPETEFVVSTFNEIIAAAGSEEDEVYDLALENLIISSRIEPVSHIVESLTLPILFGQLPQTVSFSLSNSDGYKKALSALAALSISPKLFEILSVRLSSRLEELVSSSPSTELRSDSSLYAHYLLETLRSVIQAKTNQKVYQDLDRYLENGFAQGLLNMFINPTTCTNEQVLALDSRLLVDVGKILGLILQRVDTERQTTFFRKVEDAFELGNLSELLGSDSSRPLGPEPFAPFSSSASNSQQNLSTIYSSILVSLRPQVPIASPRLSNLLSLLLRRAFASNNELQLQASLHALCNLINKRSSHEAVHKFLQQDLKVCFDEKVKRGNKEDETTRLQGLRVWTWVVKGLVVRSDETGYSMVQDLLTLFQDPVLARPAAKLLGTIAQDNDKVLTKENSAVIRLLYRQRFFTFLLPKLVDAHAQRQQGEEGTGGDQAVYLIALSNLLQHLPKQLTLTELPKLLPLLITSLDLPDPNLRSNVIDTLGILVREVPETLEPSISSIALKTLKSATTSSSSPNGPDPNSPGSVKLRLSCLQFLGTLPAHIPYLTLHPQKTVILKSLGQAIDDPRRDVRRAAVECRSKWFLYN